MTLHIQEKRTAPAVAGPKPRPRLQFWRSPTGQPAWARPGLLAVAGVAALLYTWNIADSGYAPYYSVAARSMTESWTAFLFTAFDPAATLTLDKIGGFLWPQAISARLLGFDDWALTLPQAVEGVVSVLVMFRVVRRWQGPAAGLTAAALLALTPLTASMFGHALLDAPVTMCLLLAADQVQKSLVTARPGPLLLAAVWIGVGFQAKMFFAWIVVPALALAYLVAARPPLRRRLVHLAAAGVVMLAVSLSWVALTTLTPAASRPYVDGTTDNSAFAMVFGHNGLDRIHPGLVPGSFADSGTGTGPGGPLAGEASSRAVTGSEGWDKLFGARFAAQTGWLYPLAVSALVLGLVHHRRRPRTDLARAGYLMWGGWLAVSVVLLSWMTVAHTAYAAVLAPAVAALSGAGVVALWRLHRDARGARVWVLPATVVATEAWSVHMASQYAGFASWLVPVVIVMSVAACSALVYAASPGRLPRARRIGVLGLVGAGLAMFLAPATWSFSVLDPRYSGSAFDASAGPPPGKRPGPSQGGVQTGLSPAQQQLLTYVRTHNGGAEYTFSTDSWNAAAPYILAEGVPVLPLGGYLGLSTSTTLAEYQALVADGSLRFALLGRPTNGPVTQISDWVRSACTEVSPATYGAPGAQEQLFRCIPPT